ncbi:MAG: Minf_1886 family protein [Phycisphaerales bacterium JB063]
MPMNSELMNVVQSTRYPLDAFLFIQRGLDFTVRRMHGEMDPLEEAFEGDDEPSSRHVSGQDLCRGLRDFAIREYGLLARTVLGRWHITSCRDFGEIVFAMVDGGLMHKTDDDTIRDFLNVFDFTTAFSPGLMLSEGV